MVSKSSKKGNVVEPQDASDEVQREIDFAVRSAVALLQQTLLFDDQPPTRFAFDDDELTRRIVDSLVETAVRASAAHSTAADDERPTETR